MQWVLLVCECVRRGQNRADVMYKNCSSNRKNLNFTDWRRWSNIPHEPYAIFSAYCEMVLIIVKVGQISLHACHSFLAFIPTNMNLWHCIKVTRSPHNTAQEINATISIVHEYLHVRISKVETRFAEIHTRMKIQGCTNPWRLNFVRWCLLFVGPQHGTCFMSPLCCIEN